MSSGGGVLTATAAGQEGGPSHGGAGLTLPPLAVSALMVTKADLIAALRIYVPHLSDIELIDGERFRLTVGAHPDQTGGV